MTAPQPSRWAVVWWVDGVRHERYCDDRALAEAYAASHHGRVVPLAALAPWPEQDAARGLVHDLVQFTVRPLPK